MFECAFLQRKSFLGVEAHGYKGWYPWDDTSPLRLLQRMNLQNLQRQIPKGILGVLVVLNTGIYLLWQLPEYQEHLKRHFLISGSRVKSGLWWTVLTHAFSHMDELHLGGNS